MGFTHTPAFSITIADRVTDDSIGRSFRAAQDEFAEDPRNWIDDEHVALYVFNAPRGDRDSDVPENIAIQAFARFYEIFDDQQSLQATKRWLAIFYPELKIDLEMRTIRGYSQSDWLDVVCASEEGYGSADDHIDEYRMWAFGDVWTVTPEEDGDPLSGIYADDVEEAVKQYLEQFPELKEPYVDPDETGDPDLPAPAYERDGIARWHTPDGAVVADTRDGQTRVFVYGRSDNEQFTQVTDPLVLAKALVAAAEYRPESGAR